MKDTNKAQALNLSTYLASINRKITLGQAFEAISRMTGAKSRNVHVVKEKKTVQAQSARTFIRVEVQGQVWSPDNREFAVFDAAPWFQQASDADVMSLFRDGWAGEFASSTIVPFQASRDAHIQDVVDYVAAKNEELEAEGIAGCRIGKWDALAWLKLNNAALFETILALHPETDIGIYREHLEAYIEEVCPIRLTTNARETAPGNLRRMSALKAARMMQQLASRLPKNVSVDMMSGAEEQTGDIGTIALMQRKQLIASFGFSGDEGAENWATLLLLAVTQADKLVEALEQNED